MMFNVLRRLDRIVVRLARLMVHSRQQEGEINACGVKEILCIKLWGLGNLVVIYPLLYKLKEKFPKAHITFITFDINKGFLENNRAVGHIIYVKFTTNILSVIGQFVRLISEAKRKRIDLVVNFETFNNMSAIFSYCIKAPVRIGLNNRYEGVFYTHAVAHDKAKHISEVFSDLLRPLGIDSPYQYHCFVFEDQDKSRVGAILNHHGVRQFICIHPSTSTNYIGKRCRKKLFSDLTNLLIERYDIPIIFTGTQQDQEMVGNIMAMVSRKEKTLDLVGRLSIGELAELLRRSRVFISNDTGPVHLAASMGINVAVMYGPTTPQRFGPLNDNRLIFYEKSSCSPCVGRTYLNKNCRYDFRCLDFPVQDVFNKISEKFLDAQKN